MQVKVLGPVEVHSQGERVATSQNQRLLLALLVAGDGRTISSEALAEAVWGSEQPQNPVAALQNLISRVRARLGSDALAALVVRPPGYALELAESATDAADFERRLAEARGEPDPSLALSRYASALSLWRGEAYAGFADVEGVREAAVRLEELRSLAEEERLALLVDLDPSAALPELEALVAASPYREQPRALLMTALHRSRRQREALAAYADYRTLLVEELGLEPSADLRELERRILTDTLPVDPRSPSRPPTSAPSERAGSLGNLVARRTSFVGRDDELAAICTGLEEHRLLTLVGVGGSGKTSLAIEAARLARGAHADGVWLVDLLALTDGSRLVEHVADTLDVAPSGEAGTARSLVDHLRDRQVLVVLDNCEHLVGSAAALADALLDGTSGLRILATSREPLRVPGEHVCRVAPLALPPEGADLDAVLASPSGRLFVDRVRAADPDASLGEEDAKPVATVCRRLDGIPLALELAAARVGSLGIEEVADRLDDRFTLLTSNHRTVVEHHQTLRAAIDWSVDLLPDRDRLLLARLSTFVGGFRLGAAEEVCADELLPADEVAGALAGLVDRSLVVRSRGDAVRYQLLETVREHARELLGEDRTALERRHRDFYFVLARRIGDGFLADTTPWYQVLRAELANLRAAWQWSMAGGETTQALDLAASLRWAPFNTGHLYAEHRSWVELALAAARASPDVPADVLGKGLVAAGSVAGLESRSEEALSLLTEALQLFDGLEADEEALWCHHWLGAFAADAGRHVEAVRHAADGLRLADAADLPVPVVYLANQHAENAMAASLLLPDPALEPAARASFERAIEVARAHAVEEGLVRAQHGLALLDAGRGDASVSVVRCEAALDRWRQLGSGNRLILGLVCTARVALLADDEPRASALLLEAADQMDKVGWKQPLGRLFETAAVLAVREGRLEDAAVLRGAATARFLTPRWFVPLDAEAVLGGARGIDPERWDAAERDGSSVADDVALELVRRLVG